MFNYFHKNKLGYEKGQLAPFFILIIVVIIVMAMVTMNLSKVASLKTESSNAADAGALAAGSVMANVFNSLAQANTSLEASYYTMLLTISGEFVIAGVILGIAAAKAEPLPCGAMSWIAKAIKIFIGILIAFTAFHVAQYFTFLSIVEQAEEGRKQAMVIGHKFAFINSGVGSKLKDEAPPADTGIAVLGQALTDEAAAGAGQEIKNNYRKEFSKFLDSIAIGNIHNWQAQDTRSYPWIDGMGRRHNVTSKMDIEPADNFDLKVPLNPFLAEEALLVGLIVLGYVIQGLLTKACVAQMICYACCNWPCFAGCGGCIQWPILSGIAEGLIAGTFGTMASALAGLTPSLVVPRSDVDNHMFTICWINDVKQSGGGGPYSYRSRADVTQQHQGQDLGPWKATYPKTDSFSRANFHGEGSLDPAKFKYDASIVETDVIN